MSNKLKQIYIKKSQGIKAFQKSKPVCEGCGKSDHFPYKNIRKSCEIYCGHCGKVAMYFSYFKTK